MQRFKGVLQNVLCYGSKFSSPRHNSRIQKQTPELPLVLRTAFADSASFAGGTAPLFRRKRVSLQNTLSDMPGQHAKKILHVDAKVCLHQKVEMVSADRIFMDLDVES